MKIKAKTRRGFYNYYVHIVQFVYGTREVRAVTVDAGGTIRVYDISDLIVYDRDYLPLKGE